MFGSILGKSQNQSPVATKGEASQLIEQGTEESLYLTKDGNYFWLNDISCVDADIKNTGVWEPFTTEAIRKLVKPGDTVLDIGANIGYDTVLISKIVGDKGEVLAFEPTKHYFQILNRSLAANKIQNTSTFNYGLSDKDAEAEILLGKHSASMHYSQEEENFLVETIKLRTIDEVASERKLTRLDFIKIDVDGHEPRVLEGGWQTIDKFSPVILLEVNHENYVQAGFTAWDFYDMLKGRGFEIYSEEGLKPLKTKHEFLVKCGNFAYSANIVISRQPLVVAE